MISSTLKRSSFNCWSFYDYFNMQWKPMDALKNYKLGCDYVIHLLNKNSNVKGLKIMNI